MHITTELFNDLIKSPERGISAIDANQIKALQHRFPYCEIIYNLSLLKANATNDINFTETFKMNFGMYIGYNTLVNHLGERNISYSIVFGTNF